MSGMTAERRADYWTTYEAAIYTGLSVRCLVTAAETGAIPGAVSNSDHPDWWWLPISGTRAYALSRRPPPAASLLPLGNGHI